MRFLYDLLVLILRMLYLCNVFFMVLDLRLTRLVVVRQSIFLFNGLCKEMLYVVISL